MFHAKLFFQVAFWDKYICENYCWEKTFIGWIQGCGYFFYMLRDIFRSYLGFPHLLYADYFHLP